MVDDWRQDPRFVKECGCVHHTVPHWLWMDRHDREQVREMIGRMKAIRVAYEAEPCWLTYQAVLGAVAAVAALDQPRLAEKLSNMRRLGIAEIPPDLVVQIEAEWSAPRLTDGPEPPPVPTPDQLRDAALAVEMATSPAERSRLQKEMDELDARFRKARR